MKVSYQQLIEFNQVAASYLARNKNETKLRYALQRIQAQFPTIQQKIQLQLTEIEIDYCSEDESGNILRDSYGNLKYTKEAIKKRNAAQRGLLQRKDVEIQPHISSRIPDDLTPEEQSAFAGLVIPKAQTAKGE